MLLGWFRVVCGDGKRQSVTWARQLNCLLKQSPEYTGYLRHYWHAASP